MAVPPTDQLYRSACEIFHWPLELRDQNRVPVPIEQADLILVRGTDTLPPPEDALRHPMVIELGGVAAKLAGPGVSTEEDAIMLALGRNKPWIRVEQDGQIFLRPARAVYCV